jgi:hypothetical protein
LARTLDFVRFDLGREPVLDETAILNFRRLLEQHELGMPCSSGSTSTLSRVA